MNLPNFEGVLQKKAGVYTKNFQVRGGPGPCQSPPGSATADIDEQKMKTDDQVRLLYIVLHDFM
jgi:hypothetical protein